MYSSEDKSLSPPWWKRSSVIDLRTAPPGNGAILGPRIGLCSWPINHSAVMLARSALEREAPKTSTSSESITGFSSRGRLVSSDTGGQATSTGEEDSEWLGASRLSVSSGSNQLSPFQVSGFLSFLISALTFTCASEFNCHCLTTRTIKFCLWFSAVAAVWLQEIRFF